jgi:hypothetical protein
MRANASNLAHPYSFSQQYPQEVVETSRRLVPIMLEARFLGKESVICVDKLYLNGKAKVALLVFRDIIGLK